MKSRVNKEQINPYVSALVYKLNYAFPKTSFFSETKHASLATVSSCLLLMFAPHFSH